jgi:CRP/FNR family transcriptional regulator
VRADVPDRARAGVRDRALLTRIPYFRDLSARDRGALLRRFRSLAFEPGGLVFDEGKPCDRLWVVAEGRVKIFRASASGREQVLHVEGPGATLGEVPLFDRGGYVASAAALGPARLLWLPRSDLEALCRRRPGVALAIIRTMAARVRAFAGLAGNLALRPVWERLGLLLLAEARRSGLPTAQGVEIVLPGTRDEVAALIGTVREPVSRALSALERRGLAVTRGSRVTLPDLKRLEEALGGAG